MLLDGIRVSFSPTVTRHFKGWFRSCCPFSSKQVDGLGWLTKRNHKYKYVRERDCTNVYCKASIETLISRNLCVVSLTVEQKPTRGLTEMSVSCHIIRSTGRVDGGRKDGERGMAHMKSLSWHATGTRYSLQTWKVENAPWSQSLSVPRVKPIFHFCRDPSLYAQDRLTQHQAHYTDGETPISLICLLSFAFPGEQGVYNEHIIFL